MKKTDLIEDLAAAAEVSKPQARIMVDRQVELIQTGLRKRGTLSDIRRGNVRRWKARGAHRAQSGDRRNAQDQSYEHRQVPRCARPESRCQKI